MMAVVVRGFRTEAELRSNELGYFADNLLDFPLLWTESVAQVRVIFLFS
jgi:hypothetical protein